MTVEVVMYQRNSRTYMYGSDANDGLLGFVERCKDGIDYYKAKCYMLKPDGSRGKTLWKIRINDV